MKRVRYLAGAVGIAPIAAAGALAAGGAPATAAANAASHAPKADKTVSLHYGRVTAGTDCTASNLHRVNNGYISLDYYAKQYGSKTCIGGIFAATDAISNRKIEVFVVANSHMHCLASGVSTASETCGKSFVRPFSIVVDNWSSPIGFHTLRQQI